MRTTSDSGPVNTIEYSLSDDVLGHFGPVCAREVVMSSRFDSTLIQCGVGGCRAPEVPSPIYLPDFDDSFYGELTEELGRIRKTKTPMPIYIN